MINFTKNVEKNVILCYSIIDNTTNDKHVLL